MTAHANKARIRQFVDEVLVGGDLALVDELFAPSYVVHDPSNPGRAGGIAGARAFVTLLHQGLSERAYVVEDMLAEGDRVVYRWTLRGRHTGLLMGLPPTGRDIAISGIDLFRLEHDKIIESWALADALGLLQQLGVIPAPHQATS
jgi:steroid delta-isomerase-like uncharacterized protein